MAYSRNRVGDFKAAPRLSSSVVTTRYMLAPSAKPPPTKAQAPWLEKPLCRRSIAPWKPRSIANALISDPAAKARTQANSRLEPLPIGLSAGVAVGLGL